jgi:hypothetical protein
MTVRYNHHGRILVITYCNVTVTVTLSDRDRGVTVPSCRDKKRLFVENTVSFVQVPCSRVSHTSHQRQGRPSRFRIVTGGNDRQRCGSTGLQNQINLFDVDRAVRVRVTLQVSETTWAVLMTSGRAVRVRARIFKREPSSRDLVTLENCGWEKMVHAPD